MKPRIALYRGRSLLSRVIRWRTWSVYSHAAWLCASGTVIEAWTKGGVRHVANLSVAHTPGTIVDLYEITAEVDYAAAELFLKRQLGKPYDFLGILGFILRRRCQEESRWFCSELVFSAVLAGGLRLLNTLDPWQVSPGELATSPFLTKVGTFTTEAY